MVGRGGEGKREGGGGGYGEREKPSAEAQLKGHFPGEGKLCNSTQVE